MTAYHLEILVEEESMEAFLQAVLPRLLPKDRTFSIHIFQGKHALLHNLESRLRAYARSHSFAKFREAIIEATA